MLDKIKQFFATDLDLDSGNPEEKLQLAAAALLIELSRADFSTDAEELKTIENALAKTFDLDSDKLTEIISLAHEEAKASTSLYEFTRLINDNYRPEQKYQLIVNMWQVAIADGEISKYEDHLIRKVAELTYVPHSDFIKAKLAVQV